MISCLHFGNIGDIIYALPSLKELARRQQDKIALYIKCNVKTLYYPGAAHPLKNVLINEDYLSKLSPLLLQQAYIGLVKRHENEPIDYDLNQFRKAVPDLTRNHIPRWYFPVVKVSCNLSEPWLKSSLLSQPAWHIVVSRTGRYQNPSFNYGILKNLSCSFVGLTEEHEAFCKKFFDIDYEEVEDYADLALIIANADLFIGNQSFAFALAEGLKVPRILEACPFANNVIPHGHNAYEAYCQKDFEIYLKELQ
jgi:hypothetical protein